ncbi:MAG: MOSC N-terminal beta barrel domain-containing protein, partial [Pseudomonadota bacterium]
MSATLARICRHPVKSLGEEEIGEVTLTPGQHMPWDRVWAVAHGSSDFDGSWTEPRNFVHQARSPKLAQVGVRYDEAAGRLHLSHPDLAPLDVDPAGEAEALADWIAPLASSLQQGPFRLAEMAEGRFCDFPDTHLSLATEPSRR